MQTFETSLFFRCPFCNSGDVINIEVPELNFTSDRMSEHTSEGDIEFQCPACEYDFSAHVFCDMGGCEIALYEPEGIVLRGDPPTYSAPDDDDLWTEYDPPADPFEIFHSTHSKMMALLDEALDLGEDDPQTVERMVFSQLFTAFEAYLADALIGRVIQDSSAKVSLLMKDKHINQDKFTLYEVASKDDLVDDSVKRYLRSILYHNLERVRFLYDAATGIDLRIDKESWEKLLVAVPQRHDCVHRNGFDIDGNRLSIFTKSYVKEVADLIQRTVRQIEQSLNPVIF